MFCQLGPRAGGDVVPSRVGSSIRGASDDTYGAIANCPLLALHFGSQVSRTPPQATKLRAQLIRSTIDVTRRGSLHPV